MESYHPEFVKKIPNRLLKCLDCDNPVYAKYLCRLHYAARMRQRDKEERERQKEERNKAKRDKIQLHLETHGVYCLIPSCVLLTVRESGLCEAHESRAKRWQMSPLEIAGIFANHPECKICGATESLVMDHQHGLSCEDDHSRAAGCMMCFRGLLCNFCNTGLGSFRDSPEFLQSAASYVRENSQ